MDDEQSDAGRGAIRIAPLGQCVEVGSVGGVKLRRLIHQRVGPKIGKYTVNLETLQDLAIPAIQSAIQSKELVVIDEFAPMELASPDFIPAIEAALASEKSLIIATHATLDHPLVHQIRQELKLFRVKLSNRDRLVAESVLALSRKRMTKSRCIAMGKTGSPL